MKLMPDDPKLTAYALGELAQEDRAAIAADLSQSPECQQAMDEIRSAAGLLEGALNTEPCAELSQRQQAAVMETLSKESALERRWPDWLAWVWGKPALALGGAAIVVALILALPRSPGPIPGTASATSNGVTAPVLALAPLPLKLPMPSFKGTPDDLPKGPNIEPFSDKPRPAFLAPAGVQNVALNKKVTSSDKSPITGTLSQITDGNKDAIDDAVVEMHKNVQWVQVDLEQEYNIYALLIWHDHRYVQVFRCVVVQVADDPDFTKNVRTIFNDDIENTAGLGIGKDKQYFETNQGKLIDTKGLKGRYLRFYSKGSNASALNCYTEIEVYGLPAK